MKHLNNELIFLKRLALFLTGIILSSILFGYSASAEKKLKPTDRFFINDFSNVISEADEDMIYSLGVQLQEKTGAQVVAATIDSLDDSTIREKGIEVARDWKIGQKDKNNGVLLLLAVNERKVSIEVGYGLEGDLTDIETSYILDNYALPYFKNKDYSSGMREGYRALVNEVYVANGMEPDQGYTPVKNKVQKNSFNMKKVYSYIPFGIILLIIILSFFHRGRRGGWPPFIFFGGGGFGGFGGGGFGGDSGGFSGGGGDFGGGGSSSDF